MLARTVTLFGLLVTLTASVPALAGPRDVVIIDESWHQADADTLDKNAALFARLLARAAGWNPDAVKARGFNRLKPALEYIKTARPAFVLASARPFLHLQIREKADVLAHAPLLVEERQLMRVIARRESSAGVGLHQMPGFTLATAVDGDMQWLNILFDGTLAPETHFKHVMATSLADAFAAVRAGTADLALVDQVFVNKVEPHFRGPKSEMKIVYTPVAVPPPVLLALKRNARKPDVKRLKAALEAVCKDPESRKSCLELGIVSLKPGSEAEHRHLAYKYTHYK